VGVPGGARQGQAHVRLRDGAGDATPDRLGGFPNSRLKVEFATAGERKFGNVGDPEEALRPLT
jgi:hypothetical protein